MGLFLITGGEISTLKILVKDRVCQIFQIELNEFRSYAITNANDSVLIRAKSLLKILFPTRGIFSKYGNNDNDTIIIIHKLGYWNCFNSDS